MADLDDINSTLEEIRDKLSYHKSGPMDWIWIGIAVLFFSSWAGSRLDKCTDRVWYSVRYGAQWEKVDINKGPSDCDFLHAPLGSKGCHYKKQNMIFADDERSKLIQQATTQEER